jgi:hypothetical protein
MVMNSVIAVPLTENDHLDDNEVGHSAVPTPDNSLQPDQVCTAASRQTSTVSKLHVDNSMHSQHS